jgi:protein-tyrosine sulfotransferase
MHPRVSKFLTTHPELQATANSVYGMLPSLRAWTARKRIAYCGKSAVIIVGAGRSGNTLLRRLLMERTEIYFPPETYAIGGIAANILRNPRLPWTVQVDLALGALEYQSEFTTFGVATLRDFALAAKQWPPRRQRLGDLLYELYLWLGNRHGVYAQWIGEKTPLNTLQLGLIRAVFPLANFLYIQRDPFDVVASYVNSGIYTDYEEAADRWLLSMKAWRACKIRLPQSAVCELTYEEVAANPEGELNRVIERFGMPRRQRFLDTKHLLGDVDQRSHHRLVPETVTTSRIGSSRSTLPQRVRLALAIKLNRAATMAGYAPL